MAKSRSELIHRALRNLGVLPQGQTPSAEEYNSVDDLVDTTIEDLVARSVYHVEDVDAIDEKIFMQLGHVLAWNCAPEFGLASDQAIAAKAQRAEQDLMKVRATFPTYETLEIQAY